MRILLAAAMSASIVLSVGGANAAVVHASPTTKALFDKCVGEFNSVGKGGIVSEINATGKTVTITSDGKETVTSPANKSDARDGSTGTDSTVTWLVPATQIFPTTYSPFVCAEDMCASLYHELSHALRQAKGTDFNRTECRPDYPLDTAEAEATRAENSYRVAKSLCYRDLYQKWGSSFNVPPPFWPGGPGSGTPSAVACDQSDKKPPSCGSCSVGAGGGGLSDLFAWSFGEPHMKTFDAALYDFHGVGDFILVRSTTDTFEVQGRTAAYTPSTEFVTDLTAVAVRVGTDRVGVYSMQDGSDAVVRINGVTTVLPLGGVSLAGGGTVANPGAGSLDIRWTDGSQVQVRPLGRHGLNVMIVPNSARSGQVEGLLGNMDGNANNDIKVRYGPTLPYPPSTSNLYPTFSDSWRVPGGTSLFDLGTAGSGNPSGPTPAVSTAARAAANTICSSAGVTDTNILEACIYDVALTGHSVFATAAANVQATSPTKVTLGAGASDTIWFGAMAGDRVFIEVRSTSFPDACGVIKIVDSAGTQVGSSGC